MKNYLIMFKQIKSKMFARSSKTENKLIMFLDLVTSVHGHGEIPADQLLSLSCVFMQKYSDNDIVNVKKLIDNSNGQLFSPHIYLERAIDDVKLMYESNKSITSYDGRYVYKYYKSKNVDEDIADQDFINEVIYGGYLTTVEPEMFVGTVSFEQDSSTKIIPYDSNSVDVFDLYNEQLEHNVEGMARSVRKSIALQMVQIVQRIHTLGFIHNDIKLENMLINRTSGVVSFIDFENTECIDFPHQHVSVSGTYEYCIPLLFFRNEKKRIQRTTWTDCYALSMTLMIILFDKLPENKNEVYTIRGINKSHKYRQEFVLKNEFGDFKALFYDIIVFDVPKLTHKYKSSHLFLEKFIFFIENIIIN